MTSPSSSQGVTLPPISSLLPDSKWHTRSSPSSNKLPDLLRPPALVIPPPSNGGSGGDGDGNQLLSPAASSHSPVSPHSPTTTMSTTSPKNGCYLSPISPSLSPIEPSQHTLDARSPSRDFHLQVPSFHYHRRSSDPPPQNQKYSKSPSPPARLSLSPGPSVDEEEPRVNPILFTNTGEPILKRKRGRPPNLREPVWEGGWTFVTPTVWNITSASPLSSSEQEDTETTTAFTSSTMDTVLTMPKKKRGRKPKTHIEGNSCFVWRDLTASGQRKAKAARET